MNERLKELRKKLNLTQEEFAKKIGIKRNTLATYEIGRNEPIDGIIFSICRVFNVNERWLRTGSGEMFNKQAFSLDEYARQNNLDDMEIEIIKGVMAFPAAERKILFKALKRLFSSDTMQTSLEENKPTQE